jgi:hypothetical protein
LERNDGNAILGCVFWGKLTNDADSGQPKTTFTGEELQVKFSGDFS